MTHEATIAQSLFIYFASRRVASHRLICEAYHVKLVEKCNTIISKRFIP